MPPLKLNPFSAGISNDIGIPEIKKAIKKSKIKTFKIHYYDSDPTKLTKQIEKITKYPQRKQNVKDEIKRLEESEDPNKDKKIKITK